MCRNYDLIEENNTNLNADIFARYIFSSISHRVLNERKYDMSENQNHHRIDWYLREN